MVRIKGYELLVVVLVLYLILEEGCIIGLVVVLRYGLNSAFSV